jgi:hypothetical protein
MMEPSSIDLNLLSVFQEVYRERQISSAARRLGLTQSAVSNALARLRRSSATNCSCAPRTAQWLICSTIPWAWPMRLRVRRVRTGAPPPVAGRAGAQ